MYRKLIVGWVVGVVLSSVAVAAYQHATASPIPPLGTCDATACCHAGCQCTTKFPCRMQDCVRCGP